MPRVDDHAYYRRREAQERALADTSADPAIAALHRIMAARYALLAIAATPPSHNDQAMAPLSPVMLVAQRESAVVNGAVDRRQA